MGELCCNGPALDAFPLHFCKFGGVVWMGESHPYTKWPVNCFRMVNFLWGIVQIKHNSFMIDLFPPLSTSTISSWNTSNHLQEWFLPQSFPCVVLSYWSIQQKLYEPAAIDKMSNTLKNQPWNIHQKTSEVAPLMCETGISNQMVLFRPFQSEASEFDIDDFSDYEDDTLGSPVPCKFINETIMPIHFTVA